MVWWVGVILAVVVLASVLAFFEWRSWNKPLPRMFEDATPGGSFTVRANSFWSPRRPFGKHEELERPHD